MELFGALCALYAIECLMWLTRGAVLFAAAPFGAWITSGPGLRLLPPRPAARSEIGLRFPLVELDGSLHTRGAVSWYGRGTEEPILVAALSDAEVAGRIVRAAGRAIARGVDAADAEKIARLLREIGDAEVDRRQARIDAALRESFSYTRLVAERERFERTARPLAWASDLYAVVLFALAPAAALWTGIEYALWLLGPPLLALHGGVLFLFMRAHARLFPERRADRIQALFGTAVYPPGLLRAHHHLRASVLAGYHPAAIAAAILPREAARAFMRAELAHANARAARVLPSELGFSLEQSERDALAALIAEFRESPDALLAAPDRSDPLALAYCPACRWEYRRAGGECSDCGVALERFPE